ncbi:lysophospholipid acyltransferase family protein [Uliginosibacterium gangwonense]|uniref:lysophospholipid acyltransferase family protein n=1 Tax=Uliginosibacterium gangwonense TaxID=392736 RepID=UPI000373B35B|nr:lysophospholipid acyltransferase family protein [Uliginosibacterium gangwonense]
MAWLLSWGLLAVRLLFPRWSSAQRQAIKHRWARKLVSGLGVRLPEHVDDIPTRALIVSNHVSWLDIYVINALAPTHFVSKDDVRSWPVIGWLVEHTDTLFLERGSRLAAARTAQSIAERLRGNERVTVFPEGTTTLGDTLLPFRPALFQAGIDAAAEVQPVALRYVDQSGQTASAPVYAGETTFWECLRAIVLSSGLHVELSILPAIPSAQADRRDLARQSQAAIANALGLLALHAENYDTAPASAPDEASIDGELACSQSE